MRCSIVNQQIVNCECHSTVILLHVIPLSHFLLSVILPNVIQLSIILLNPFLLMEQCTLKNVNNFLNTNIYAYLETSGGQSYNLYLNAVHLFSTSVN